MNSEPTPTRRPIAAVRISTVALLGIVAAVAVPAVAAAIVVSGTVDSRRPSRTSARPGPSAASWSSTATAASTSPATPRSGA